MSGPSWREFMITDSSDQLGGRGAHDGVDRRDGEERDVVALPAARADGKHDRATAGPRVCGRVPERLKKFFPLAGLARAIKIKAGRRMQHGASQHASQLGETRAEMRRRC